MKRLHKLTAQEIAEWRDTRGRIGRDKYGDAHLQRYNLVDVMEELLDAINIYGLFMERTAGLKIENPLDRSIYGEAQYDLRFHLTRAADALVRLDKHLPDDLCTDEQGGERIWWGDE